MKSTYNSQTDKLIGRAAAYRPQLQDPMALTDRIMTQVASRPIYLGTPAYVFWIRAVSGLAALWLIALFVWQQNEQMSVKAESHRLVETYSVSPHVFDMESYLGHLRCNVADNKRMTSYYTSFIPLN